jgi:hypothetical protein
MRGNVIDLVVVVLPFLRPLRVVRSARVMRILRLPPHTLPDSLTHSVTC